MNAGQLLYVILRLALGAVASFFAIALWSKTRDLAWILMVLGTLSAYIETVYSILGLFGMTGAFLFTIGPVPALTIILACLPELFFIVAFCVMLKKRMK